MKKRRSHSPLILIMLIGIFCCHLHMEARTVKKSQLPLADPYVLVENNTYYAYGTHSDHGIEVYTSTDLKNWECKGLALKKEDVTARRWYWAPEVYHLKGKYYMFFSGDEHLYVATSDSPLGPFKQVGDSPMLAVGSIDSSLFIDDDGTPYLFFVLFNKGNAIWMAELNDDLTTLRYETLRECIKVSQAWERDPKYPGSIVNEGPIILKRNDTYYMTYSANDYQSKLYGIGLATCRDLKNGTWEKSAHNPIFQSVDGLVGTGHHSIFTDLKGQLQMVFHAHNSNEKIHPRLTYFVKTKWSTDGLTFGKRILSPKLR